MADVTGTGETWLADAFRDALTETAAPVDETLAREVAGTSGWVDPALLQRCVEAGMDETVFLDRFEQLAMGRIEARKPARTQRARALLHGAASIYGSVFDLGRNTRRR